MTLETKPDAPKKDGVKGKKERKRAVVAGDRVGLITHRYARLKKMVAGIYICISNLPLTSDKPQSSKADVKDTVIKMNAQIRQALNKIENELTAGDKEDIFIIKEGD